MIYGELNTHPLNGPATSGQQSVASEGNAYAVGTVVRLRLGARSPVGGDAVASGAMAMRLGGGLSVVGDLSATGPEVLRRFASGAATGNAQAAALVDLRRMMAAVAQATLVLRNAVRAPIDGSCSAAATPRLGTLARVAWANLHDAIAQADPVLSNHERHYYRFGFVSDGYADGAVLFSKLAGSPIEGNAIASGEHLLRGLLSFGAAVEAEAQGVINSGTDYRPGYDEPATPECTFVIPPEPNFFMVTDMPLVASIRQQPRDERDYDISFDEFWPSDDRLIEVVATATPDTLTVATAIDPSERIVKVWIRGGVDGTTYKVTLLGRSSDGRAKEVEIKAKIKDD